MQHMADLVLTATDNNGSFEVRIGESITINLEENRSTAFMWQDADKAGKNVLALVRDDYILPQKIEFGSGGMRILQYEAKDVGTVTIELQKRRGWEKNKFIESFIVTVTVTT